MSATTTSFVTITCDGPNCKTLPVTFAANQEEKAKAGRENPWLETTQRAVGRPDGTQFIYCSDTCEAEALAAGTHNIPRIVLGDAQQAQLAAQAQQRALQATAALKQGQPVTLS